jgi:hypothetical protein
MILINLLPPEMRKKQGNVNPLLYAVAACYLVALVPAGTWLWLKYVRLPAAEEELASRTAVLDQKTAEAAAVEALGAQIAEAEAHRDQVIGLLSRKVYWAHALDEFVNHLNGPGGTPWKGFEVSCIDLNIQPISGTAPAAKKDPIVMVGVRGRFKIVGLERDKAGDYIREFFATTESSKFWSGMGFVGKPELTYRGDTPDWKPAIDRIAVEFSLDWVRIKKIAGVKPAGGM